MYYQFSPRLAKEARVLWEMQLCYCQAHHQASALPLCEACEQQYQYGLMRLDRCAYGEQKPACVRCPVHCYKPEPKQMMKQVMRYAGPRMLLKQPMVALKHLWDSRQPPVAAPVGNQSNRQRLKKLNAANEQ